jgi:hypothetical protein
MPGALGDRAQGGKMMSDTQNTEIESILRCAGPVFDGGTDDARRKLTCEWAEEFSPRAVEAWVADGCWCPSAADSLQAHGYNPDCGGLRYIPGREVNGMDAMYAYCNGDACIDDITW